MDGLQGSPFLVQVLSIVQGFIRAKPRFWTHSDLLIFKSKLDPSAGCSLPRKIRMEAFFEGLADLSDSDIQQVRSTLAQLFQHFDVATIDQPFHLFSGVTWPVALLWFVTFDRENLLHLLNRRGDIPKGSIVKETIQSFYGVPDLFSAECLDLHDFGVELLAGLRPLTNPEVVKERMLELVDDARVEFCDSLNRGALLITEKGRVQTRNYVSSKNDPQWCNELIGIQAKLMQTAKNDVRLHIQYFTGERNLWRILLSFEGPYQSLQSKIVRQAEIEEIGVLNFERNNYFELSREITPEWNRWDEQRQELAKMALETYRFFAGCPMPPA
jgi:hypothetical protein